MKISRSAAPFLLAAVAVLAGCASPGDKSADPDKPALLPAPASLPASKVSIITIYHPAEGDAEDGHPAIALNGSDLVSIGRGRTFTARLLPGEYRITVDDDKAGTLRSKPGEHYYFYLAIVPGNFSGHGRLGLVSPQQGKDQTAHLEPIDKDDIENPAFR